MDMITSSSSSFAPSQPQQVSGGSHLRITAAAAANLHQPLKCPRCDSTNTKFCYYNNYSLSQPRHFCKACKRYWTRGGTLRNVPVGGGCRKNKRVKKPSPASPSPQIPPTTTSFVSLPPASSAAAAPSSSVNPFLYTLTGTNNLQIPQLDNMGIGEYRSDLSGQSMMDSFNEFQQQDCSLPTSCSILQDYSLAPKMSNIPSSSWLPLYQSLHGNAFAGNGLYREVKDEGRFDAQPVACGDNQSGSVIVDGNPFWSSAVSSVWSAEPTSFFGSSATTPLL